MIAARLGGLLYKGDCTIRVNRVSWSHIFALSWYLYYKATTMSLLVSHQLLRDGRVGYLIIVEVMYTLKPVISNF